ncbi:hypothetical protein FOZ60_011314 [Perkinsus olseni]|uniref:Uncharacterized protein n=1 Tax=Perkinsus olseni TaxID=32597 RepID=A0A7J6PAY4_PEROL|nr:hypothetical protein FOZ60_011314 [Perkinsus olseni]
MMSLPYPFSATAAGPTTVSPLAFIIPSLLYVAALGTFVHAPFMDNLILHLASLEKLWNVFSIILGLLFGFYTTEMAGGRGEDRVEALEAMGLLRKNDGIARPLSVPAVYSSFLRILAAIDDVPMHVRLSVQADLTVCRGSAGDSMMFLSTPVPPTLSWIVHGGTWAFLLFMPFGYVAPLANHDTQAVIVISSCIFIIMHTWLLTTDYVLNSTRGFDLHKYWLSTVATIESLVGQSIIEHPQGDESKPRRSSRRRGLQDKKNA